MQLVSLHQIHFSFQSLQVQRHLGSMPESAYSELFTRLAEATCRLTDHSTAAVLALAVALASLVVQWGQWGGAMEALSNRCFLWT